MKRLVVLALVLVFCARVSAETSKFDPPDPRLGKKVTLNVNHGQLQEVAKSLTEQTGVTVQAGSGTRDWKVRETRVSVRVKDASLESVLIDTTRLLGYYLSREGKEGAYTYIIWQDKKSRDLEAEMVVAQKEAAAKRVKDAREAVLNDAADAMKMTPEEAMKLKDKDPMMAYMGGTQSGRAFSQILSSMSSMYPTEYDLMMRGKRSFMPISGMSPDLKKAVNTAVSTGFGKAIREQDKNSEGSVPYQIVMMPMSDLNDESAGVMGMNNVMFITGTKDGASQDGPFGGGRPISMFPIVDPGSAFADIVGEAMLAVESGEPIDEVMRRIEPKMSDPETMQKARAKDSPTEKKPPTDPELTREIEIRPESLGPAQQNPALVGMMDQAGQEKLLTELSRAIGWNLYLEAFSQRTPLGVFIHAGKQPLYKVLVALEKSGYTWERGDKSLRVRPENWALQRSYAIPDSHLTFYKDLLKKQGTLSLDDAAGIADGLTDEQLQNTFLVDPDLNFLQGTLGRPPVGGSLDILRLYASLDQIQKAALSSESGLPFEQLTDVQWNRMNEIITDKSGGIYVTGGTVRLIPLTDKEIAAGMQRRNFDVSIIVQGETEPHKSTESVFLPSKQQLIEMRDSRKQAEEQRKAAEAKMAAQAKQKTDAPKPAPAPAPTK